MRAIVISGVRRQELDDLARSFVVQAVLPKPLARSRALRESLA